MYTIDTIPMTDYGLHIASHEGELHLVDAKDQFFTAYETEGFQITKRKENELLLNGFIIASDLADFKTKTAALYTALSASGTRAIVLNPEALTCFGTEGYTIDKVRVFNNAVYARFKMKLIIV